MSEKTFFERLDHRIVNSNNRLCIGLDSELARLPDSAMKWRSAPEAIFRFNKEIVDRTHFLVAAYKPNLAFYKGEEGIKALKETVDYIHRMYPNIQVVLDSKRGDSGNTNRNYMEADLAFDQVGADAITVHPYLGYQSIWEQLQSWPNKGFFVLCRTSNNGAGEFQDLKVSQEGEEVRPFYLQVAKNAQDGEKWNSYENVGLVVGATYPEEAAEIREMAPDLFQLVPGVGHQPGDLQEAVKASSDEKGGKFFINFSRSIIFASDGPDFAEAAREEAMTLRVHINDVLPEL